MKEFIEKLIGRLEENLGNANFEKATKEVNESFYEGMAFAYGDSINIVTQLAEEYKHCNKPSCKDCEVYDTEKHYCPKWCDVIKHTAEELAEEYNNDFCEWEKGSSGYVGYPAYYSKCCTTKSNGLEIQTHIISDWKYCPYCGKKIKVVE